MSKLRDKVAGIKDIKEENLYVPEWDVTFLVRALTGAARNKILNAAMDKNGKLDLDRFYPDLIIAACFDPESGEQVFEPTDRDMLLSKSGSALERIAQKAIKMSGLDDIEAKEKNS
ncbi:hypothetical protein EDC32_1089 [Laceyella sacchari]|uniref:hypothetical protein n=1 Tax=Laceyella sacchari TaxID=37482 RepID=UPI000AEE7FC4|nr:hypothetical protein [Laceyella sacchari]TCW35297.1 hypothetical protein EDC32_1089 [Laceyella sacchari]